MKGKIIKGIGGFYYVQTPTEIIECKARGLFRKTKESLLVGDDVDIEPSGEKGKGYITKIYPRKNELIRPAVSNIDQILLLFALESPKPNFNLLDRFLVMLEHKGLPVIIGFNKSDLDNSAIPEAENYRNIGYSVFFFSAHHSDLSSLRKLLHGKTTALAGPSGTGKSTLVNLWQKEIQMEVGGISEKIGRGKHTTRHVNLIPLDEESFIVDTPGFTTLELSDLNSREIKHYFPDFSSYADGCQFLDCLHDKENKCAVKAAVQEGKIWKSRYESYLQLKEQQTRNNNYR